MELEKGGGVRYLDCGGYNRAEQSSYIGLATNAGTGALVSSVSGADIFPFFSWSHEIGIK